ncbi:hypothetical protein QBC35DRAFT_449057 [Podospora australis]|uniref:Uncharacterized protein n=1 Tax=Podospora australis TaxID=1536484 RepID=A0AAN6WYL8_9PEZI|nr:hypothetical protein QBC35DRAFT_449057 [Podospora australis]
MGHTDDRPVSPPAAGAGTTGRILDRKIERKLSPSFSASLGTRRSLLPSSSSSSSSSPAAGTNASNKTPVRALSTIVESPVASSSSPSRPAKKMAADKMPSPAPVPGASAAAAAVAESNSALSIPKTISMTSMATSSTTGSMRAPSPRTGYFLPSHQRQQQQQSSFSSSASPSRQSSGSVSAAPPCQQQHKREESNDLTFLTYKAYLTSQPLARCLDGYDPNEDLSKRMNPAEVALKAMEEGRDVSAAVAAFNPVSTSTPGSGPVCGRGPTSGSSSVYGTIPASSSAAAAPATSRSHRTSKSSVAQLDDLMAELSLLKQTLQQENASAAPASASASGRTKEQATAYWDAVRSKLWIDEDELSGSEYGSDDDSSPAASAASAAPSRSAFGPAPVPAPTRSAPAAPGPSSGPGSVSVSTAPTPAPAAASKSKFLQKYETLDPKGPFSFGRWGTFPPPPPHANAPARASVYGRLYPSAASGSRPASVSRPGSSASSAAVAPASPASLAAAAPAIPPRSPARVAPPASGLAEEKKEEKDSE